MSARRRILVLCVSAPIVAFALVGGFIGLASARDNNAYQHLRVFEDVVSLILNNYVEEVEFGPVLEGAMRGLTEALDADSAFLQPEEVERLESGAPLPEGVTGLELTRQYYLRVIAARDGSPAAEAGLRPGDYLRAIDGQSTRDMSVLEGAWRLRGEPGSTAKLTVLRGSAAEPQVIDLVRQRLTGPEVTSRLLDGGIGYVRIAAFSEDVPEQVRSHVAELARREAARLVLDVRRTAEGPLEAGIATARLFIPSGTLVVRQQHGDEREPIAARAGDGVLTLPMVLLVDRGSAGPAELLAAALTTGERADLVGERTVGRAATQRLVRLPDGSALWISVSRYLNADGDLIHERGVEPDLLVEEPDQELGAPPSGRDPILERAIEHLAARDSA